LDITSHKGFVRIPDTEFAENLKTGTVIAGVNGTWQAQAAEETWGGELWSGKTSDIYLCGQAGSDGKFCGI